MTNKKLEQAMPYILVGICFAAVGISVSERALSLGVSSFSSHFLLMLIVGLALIFYHQFQQLFNELFERMMMKVPYFRSKWKKDSAEEVNAEIEEEGKTERSLKVTTDVLSKLLQQAGISAVSTDKAKMARLIGYLSGFSDEKIRKRLSNPEELTSYHKEEVEYINNILSSVKCEISIKYNKHR